MKLLTVSGHENYQVSDTGLVWSEHKQDYLAMHPHKDVEYLTVQLWKDNQPTMFYVHRLVAQVHIPNPLNLPEVNHVDGNKLNNHISNLQWVDSSGNSQHAVKTGLRTYTNRLTRDEFIECLESVIGGETYAALSERVPYKVPFLSTKLKAIAKELGREQELANALKAQRAERNRKVLEVVNASKVQRLGESRTLK